MQKNQKGRLTNTNIEIGKFQKNVIYSKAVEAILGDAVRTITKADPAWKTIVYICASINKIPSKLVLLIRIR